MLLLKFIGGRLTLYTRNCPKYINVRSLVPKPDTSPKVIYENLQMNDTERLPEAAIDFIHSSDTVFLGTSYEAATGDNKFPSHAGMNHRGGRAGFIRVIPSDGRTVVLPDYSGELPYNSLMFSSHVYCACFCQ